MAKFFISVTYSAEGAKGLRKDGGTKRRHVVKKAIESLGGTLESFYYCLGDFDAILIVELPDSVAAAAMSLAVTSTGAVHLSTYPLLTPEEIDKATAKKTAYKAPGT
jgi:uncharacterized protein with GYD domain